MRSIYFQHSDALRPRTLSGVSNYYASLFGPVVESERSVAQETLDALVVAPTQDDTAWDVIDLHPLAPRIRPYFRGSQTLSETPE